MGCLLAGLAAALLLAVPASIAPASLSGAYLVIGLLTAGACATAVWTARRRARRAADAQGGEVELVEGPDAGVPGAGVSALREPGPTTAVRVPGATRALRWIAAVAVVYAGAVTVIHFAS